MRRVTLGLLGTVIGTTLLVGLKTQSFATPLGLTVTGPADPADGATASDPAAPGGPTGPDGVPAPQATPGRTATTGAPRPSGSTTRPTGPASTTTTTAPPTTTTVKGMAVAVRTAQSPTNKSNPCGECHNYSISVTITVTGGRVTSASASYNTSPGASQSYASRANSSLSQKILSSQTWQLGRVSGATYSGNAWELSVKDAMSKAGLPV